MEVVMSDLPVIAGRERQKQYACSVSRRHLPSGITRLAEKRITPSGGTNFALHAICTQEALLHGTNGYFSGGVVVSKRANAERVKGHGPYSGETDILIADQNASSNGSSNGTQHRERRAGPHADWLAKLKESELRYRRLFETAKDGILILDGDTGIVTDVNPFLVDFLGYRRDEIIGRAFWEFGPFRDTAANRSKFRQLHHVEYLKYANLPLQSKAGEIKNVEFVTNLYLVDDKPVVQCNIREITDRVRIEEGVRRENEEMVSMVTALRRRDAEMQAINRMNDLLQTCTVKEEAYKVITLMAGDVFELRPGAVAIVHPEDQHLETVSRWGSEVEMEAAFKLEDCWAIRRGQPHEVPGTGDGLPCAHFSKQPAGGSYCLPLMVQGETLGLLTLTGQSGQPDGTQRNYHALAQSMGEAVKLSLSNLRLREKLREQATHDALTGLCNIRYLDEYLPRELHRSARAKSPLCVAMLDLDHFKRLNDTLGHHAGDGMLREVGALLRQTLRQSDMAIRYGGEEFLLVLPDSSLSDAIQCIEQIRAGIRGIVIHEANGRIGQMTVSAGIAMAGEHGLMAKELIRAADNALYSAKQNGRDRAVVYSG
jgi:diguanylate cyclase (GGDEF)-like protein/PAS domain S-box-containing protein